MTKKIFLIIASGFFIFMFQASTFAELYKYVDENGVVSYTDDYSKVSKSEKGSLKVIKEIESSEEIESSNDKKPSVEGDKVLQGNKPDKKGLDKELEALIAQLDLKKVELNEEYSALDTERRRLEQEKKIAKTDAEKLLYQDGIKNLNVKIKQYTDKTKDYQKMVKNYQKMVVEYNNKIYKQ
jgi:IS1 family transposase